MPHPVRLGKLTEEGSMANQLPYVNQPGTMVKILGKIKEAKTPDRFTTDFLETMLGFRGGNSRQFIPLAKKIGLLNSDGTPRELYKKYRNDDTSKAAMADALRTGYRELFERNEYANKLNKDSFRSLVVEITGLEAKSRVVQLICQTFENLRGLADFEASLPPKEADNETAHVDTLPADNLPLAGEFGLNLAYTINLVLPKTDDPAIFNAIFRALRDNLLRK
jgi:hypothetical protein